jgi:ergothioneine biosynthesis protein EgtB
MRVPSKQEICNEFQATRRKTVALCSSLEIEDFIIQSTEDVSPPKWHLAHTTWFFETFALMVGMPNYQPFDPKFQSLFNSYYQQLNAPYPRARRGLLSRPTVEAIFEYRNYVDLQIIELINNKSDISFPWVASIIELGLQHEQQHQELLLMDIKHNFSIHPDFPAYTKPKGKMQSMPLSLFEFIDVDGGLIDIGHCGNTFCFDNELPRHRQFINPYKIANRLVTNGEFLEFIEATGYQQPKYWLADGWASVVTQNRNAPLYWLQLEKNQWYIFTLSGLQTLRMDEPVSHVSYYEADAYARWREARLPTESEWEHIACAHRESISGNFLETAIYHPHAPLGNNQSYQFFGDVWEWTSSPYVPYHGYQPLLGALGEYNGKFMCNQIVLRGGSCVTPQTHIRDTYRNFYGPDKRWQFGGIRLAM